MRAISNFLAVSVAVLGLSVVTHAFDDGIRLPMGESLIVMGKRQSNEVLGADYGGDP